MHVSDLTTLRPVADKKIRMKVTYYPPVTNGLTDQRTQNRHSRVEIKSKTNCATTKTKDLKTTKAASIELNVKLVMKFMLVSAVVPFIFDGKNTRVT